MYFDGDCAVCSREVGMYRKLDRDGGIVWYDVSSDTGDLVDGRVSRSDALSGLHARLPDGRLVTGVDAFVAVWERLPGFEMAARVARWRPARWMLETGYGWYAPRRKRLARFLEPRPEPTSRRNDETSWRDPGKTKP